MDKIYENAEEAGIQHDNPFRWAFCIAELKSRVFLSSD